MRMKFDLCWVDGFNLCINYVNVFLQTICVILPVSCICRCSIAFLHDGGCNSRIGIRCFPEHICGIIFLVLGLALMNVSFVLL